VTQASRVITTTDLQGAAARPCSTPEEKKQQPNRSKERETMTNSRAEEREEREKNPLAKKSQLTRFRQP